MLPRIALDAKRSSVSL